MKDNTRQAAFDAWTLCMEYDTQTDYKINDLLESIAGKRYDIYGQDNDPIWTIIGSLTATERRRFIKGVNDIIKEVRCFK